MESDESVHLRLGSSEIMNGKSFSAQAPAHENQQYLSAVVGIVDSHKNQQYLSAVVGVLEN